MTQHHQRKAPAGEFARVLRLMDPVTRLIVLVAIPLAFLGLVQLVTQVFVQMLANKRDFDVLPMFSYLLQWGRSNPATEYGLPEMVVWHWVIASFLLTVSFAVLLIWLRVRTAWMNNPQRRAGLATPEEVEKELGRSQLLKRSPHLRPSLKSGADDPTQVGYFVGDYRGKEVWLRCEDPTIVIGPSRAGKGWRLLLRWIMSAPGAIITTSSKLDNAKLTMLGRKASGSRPWIFAPGIPDGESFGHVLRWDPIAGCVSEDVLVRRIHALIPSDSFSGSTSNGGHWDTLGQQLASHLFHAAACGGKTVDAVWEWVTLPKRAEEAVRLIREHPDGLPEHANHLEAVLQTPPEQRASQWGVLPTVLAFMESRSARAWMIPTGADDEFDPVRFVLNRESLYLVGDKKATGGFVRILDGLLAELDHVTKGLAGVSPGDRLDPPVTYILDEAGNIEYQGLNELITAGGGRGRVGIAVFQSKTQLQQYGGQEAEDTLWDAATAKIVLPGGGNPKTLQEMSDLIGKTWVEAESNTLGGVTGTATLSAEKREIFEASEIRTLETGSAFVFYRNLPPALPACPGFDTHPDFAKFQADAEMITVESRERSEFAGALDAHQKSEGV